MKIFYSEQFIDIKYITKKEIIELLNAKGELQQSLFRRAREIRKESDLNKVTFRGVIEISNLKENNTDNQNLVKYTLTSQEILAIAKQIKAANIDNVVLKGRKDIECESILEEVIPSLKNELNLSVLLCLGEQSKEIYQKYAELGADSYLLEFETSDPILYQKNAYSSLKKRLKCIHILQQLEFKVGTGNVIGLPEQTLENIAEDILLALEIQPAFISCDPFINSSENYDLILNTIAIYRLALKQCLITSVNVLEKIKPDGQLMGLNAGANVLDINFTPSKFGQQCAIYSHQRFSIGLKHALNILKRVELEIDS